MEKGPGEKKRAFTIELDSGDNVKRVTLPNDSGGILIEGTIGQLKHASLVEDSVLELTGTVGVLRVDLSSEDIASLAKKMTVDPRA